MELASCGATMANVPEDLTPPPVAVAPARALTARGSEGAGGEGTEIHGPVLAVGWDPRHPNLLGGTPNLAYLVLDRAEGAPAAPRWVRQDHVQALVEEG